MSEILELNWDLTDPQYQFFTSTAKYRAFISGVGAGKTAVGCMLAINEAIEQPGSSGVVVTGTYRMLNDVLLPEFFRWLPRHVLRDFNRSDMLLELTNGSTIRFRSGEDSRTIERLRGSNLTWFWIDEAALCSKALWDILLGRLRQIGFQHKCWVTSTPKGINWLYDVFVKSKPAADSFVLTRVPSTSNRYLSEAYFQSLESQYTGQFRLQELYGEFVKFEGLVYQNFNDSMIVTSTEQQKHIVYGLDVGYRNPTCLLALGEFNGKVTVLDEVYETRLHEPDIVNVVNDMQQRYGHGPVFVDPSEPGIIDLLLNAGLKAEKASNAVTDGIRRVSSFIDSGEFKVHQRCRNLINELNMYCYTSETKESVVKAFDHACDALRYGIMGMNSGGAQPQQSRPSIFPKIHLNDAADVVGYNDLQQNRGGTMRGVVHHTIRRIKL